MPDTTHGTARAYADNLTIRERAILDITCARIVARPDQSPVDLVTDAVTTTDAVLKAMNRPE
jgi:hypothetical protein